MSSFIVGILVSSFLLFSSGSYADSPRLIVYYAPLPPLISEDGKTGALASALKELGLRANVRFDLRYLTPPRIVRKLNRGERMAMVPVLRTSADTLFDATVYLSAPIGFRISQIYTRKGEPPLEVIEPSKVIVTTPTAKLPTPFGDNQKLTTLETHSLASALTILSKGRADIFVNDITVTDFALRNLNIENITRYQQGPRFIQPAHIVFSSAISSRIRSRINVAILSMVADGTLKRLLPQNFVDDYMAFQRDQVRVKQITQPQP